MNANFIKRIPAIEGIYGERIVINSKSKDLYSFFKLISAWSVNSWFEEDSSHTTTWELPIGVSVYNNEIIRNAIKKAGVNIEEG